MNTEYANIAKNYKRTVAGRFMLVEGAKLAEKIFGEDFCVTQKMDGIMQVLFWRDGKASAYSSHGNPTDESLPCMVEFAKIMERSGLKEATFGAELYAKINPSGRERVGDVATALADKNLHGQLQLAVFDIIDINGSPFEASHYHDKISKIKQLFSPGLSVRPVDSYNAQGKQEVELLYEQLVAERGAEGIVVHCEIPIIYKVKPRHTIDAVIIGYTLGEDERSEMVRDILVAVMHPDGTLQQLASIGSGLTDELRQSLYALLSASRVESDYIETDSRNVAFQMIRPEIIVEISAIDFVTENTAGEPKRNMLIEYTPREGYKTIQPTAGVALHSPVFVRLRPDKTCEKSAIPVSQLTDLCEFAKDKTERMDNLPKSEILFRQVYHKGSGFKRMIQKYVVWKTNKEHTGQFPAYVFHYTDFSMTRAESLRRDIRISNSREQIMQLCDEFISANVKKGWQLIS